MKTHNTPKELLVGFMNSINNYATDQDEVNHIVDHFLSTNNLALGKQKPLEKNKQTKNFCESCGNKLQFIVETDINSKKVCKSSCIICYGLRRNMFRE